MTQMVILDRDGVINHDSADYIKTADEWRPIPGSLEAIKRLKNAGYLVTVATNQSGLARGLFTEESLQKIHNKMHEMLAERGTSLDGIFYCPHGPSDNCACRKPEPGLLFQIADKFDIDLSKTSFVGDSMSDIRAARMADARPVLVRTGKGEDLMQNYPASVDVPVFKDLSHFVRETLKTPDYDG
jgi:D-glycero-D-manno-heptose 1,7-bisphosphate phosphatase